MTLENTTDSLMMQDQFTKYPELFSTFENRIKTNL